MPKIVDHDARRQRIALAALAIIAEEGTKAVSIRSIAAMLGGSAARVTHYYPTRADLMLDLVTQLSATWQAELDQLLSNVQTPGEALRSVVHWLLPLDEDSQREERARFQILSSRDEPGCIAVLVAFDNEIRVILREILNKLVPAPNVERVLDLLRSTTNGISLSNYTDPVAWPAARQLDVVDLALDRIIGDA